MNDSDNIFVFENASFGYHSYHGKTILIENYHDIFEKGEFIALIGRNGTGKSTFLKSLVKLLPALSGEINLQGRAFEDYSLSEFAKVVSFVSTALLTTTRMTVLELVSLGRFPYTNWIGSMTKKDHDKVREAIELSGINNLLDKQIFRISDGERQKAMIARTLAQDTPVIVLDEPTAFLDLPNKYELAALLSKLSSMGKTIIMSTHDIEIALRFPDKLLMINNKRIFSGSPEDMVINADLNKVFYTTDFRINESSGEIEISRNKDKNIVLLSANNMLYDWTRKALNRAGFEISDNEEASAQIEIQNLEDVNVWVYKNTGQELSFNNIYSLIKFLKNRKD